MRSYGLKNKHNRLQLRSYTISIYKIVRKMHVPKNVHNSVSWTATRLKVRAIDSSWKVLQDTYSWFVTTCLCAKLWALKFFLNLTFSNRHNFVVLAATALNLNAIDSSWIALQDGMSLVVFRCFCAKLWAFQIWKLKMRITRVP